MSSRLLGAGASMPASVRRASIKYLLVLAVAASALSVGVIAPTQASAASRITGYSAASSITGCFNYRGVAVTGLYALVQVNYTDGTWRAVPGGGVGLTNSNGCIRFNIAAGWQRTFMKISAIGYVRPWNLIVTGTTPNYGPKDNGSWHLGNASMWGFRAPAATSYEFRTGDWLDAMLPPSPGPDPVKQLSLEIDRRVHADPRLQANVIVTYCFKSGRTYLC